MRNKIQKRLIQAALPVLTCGLAAITLAFGGGVTPANASAVWNMHLINTSGRNIRLHPRDWDCMLNEGGNQVVAGTESKTFKMEDSNNIVAGCFFADKWVRWQVAIDGLPAPTVSNTWGMQWFHYKKGAAGRWYSKVTNDPTIIPAKLGVPATAVRCGSDHEARNCMGTEHKHYEGDVYFHFDFVQIALQDAGVTYMSGDNIQFSGTGAQGYKITLYQRKAGAPVLPGCENVPVDNRGKGNTDGKWSCTSSALPSGVTQVVAVQNDSIFSYSMTPYTVLDPLVVTSPEVDNRSVRSSDGPFVFGGTATAGATVSVRSCAEGSPPGATPFNCTAVVDASKQWSCGDKFLGNITGAYQWEVTQSLNGYSHSINTSTGYYQMAVYDTPVSIDPIGNNWVVSSWNDNFQIHGMGSPGQIVKLDVVKDGDANQKLKSTNCPNNTHKVPDTGMWGCNYSRVNRGGKWNVTVAQYRSSDNELMPPKAKASFTINPAQAPQSK
ncbi:hypothetical protein [Xenorhabdus miraniensis]|nr:hypothetical protein [Xenorhabdus miraniensis]